MTVKSTNLSDCIAWPVGLNYRVAYADGKLGSNSGSHTKAEVEAMGIHICEFKKLPVIIPQSEVVMASSLSYKVAAKNGQ